MKNYLRWGFRQLYLIYFWPTEFGRKVEGDGPDAPKLRAGERFRYMMKLLPFITVIMTISTFLVSYLCEAYGFSFKRWDFFIGILLSLPACVIIGVMVDVRIGIVGGVAIGVVGSMVGSMAVGVPIRVAWGILVGTSIGMGVGIAVGVLSRITRIIIAGSIVGIVFGVTGGMAYSIGFGVAGGVSIPLALWAAFFRVVTYPLDMTLSTAAYLVARRQPGKAIQMWRWCPVAWNEVIWLPLPFVGKLLALMVRQDREEGFRRIAFVAAERRLQRRAAVAALAEVALDDLRALSVWEIADVADRLSWTTDAPTKLPDDLASALPRFDRAAQHAGQYLNLNSPYRKKEALRRALAELDASRRSRIVESGPLTPPLLRTADAWRVLLEAELKALKETGSDELEIPNPFVYGNPVMETEHNVFTGRRDVVREIEASLLGAARAPTLLLQGPRRMGKTSILNQLPRLLGPDFAPAVVDCQNPAVTGSEATLLRYLSRALSEGLRRRRVSVEALTAAQVGREPFADFDEWLDKVERAMPGGMRALLCLDEYERLQSALEAGWGASFLDALRHTFQHRPRVVLMFTGAHTFQELGPAWTDRFVSARRMRVSFLTRADVELLLTKPIPEFDMTYAGGALDALVAATNCHPFLTQAVAFELVQLLNESQRREATAADVEEAVRRALVSGDAYFVNVWDDAGAQGRAILSALASGGRPPHFPTADTWLHEHDVLDADGGFAVEMMRRWVAAKTAAAQGLTERTPRG